MQPALSYVKGGLSGEGCRNYYDAYRSLSDAQVRRLWILEGKRRGYELA